MLQTPNNILFTSSQSQIIFPKQTLSSFAVNIIQASWSCVSVKLITTSSLLTKAKPFSLQQTLFFAISQKPTNHPTLLLLSSGINVDTFQYISRLASLSPFSLLHVSLQLFFPGYSLLYSISCPCCCLYFYFIILLLFLLLFPVVPNFTSFIVLFLILLLFPFLQLLLPVIVLLILFSLLLANRLVLHSLHFPFSINNQESIPLE